ncbi:hypothetical protein [Rhodospirillum centenum]|nr:hypothetical protein [Rhodospirillum centenum]
MSDRPPQVDRRAVDLLLQILETPGASVTAAAIETLGPDLAAPLIGAGLLKPAGHEATAVSMSDHDDVPVNLTRSAENRGYGYFSPTAGWITVPTELRTRHRVDIPMFMAQLLASLDRRSAGTVPLIPELLWEVGDVRLGRRPQRVPLWFARRLHDQAVWRQVKGVAQARPAPGLRVLLTSTAFRRVPDEGVAGHEIISVPDVIDHNAGVALHPEILAARVGGRDHRSDGPLAHTADFTVVTVHGKDYPFRGAKQRDLVRQLVDAFQRGAPRCLTAKVLEEANYNSSVNTIAKAFSGRDDWREFIAEDGGSCWIFT